MHPKNRATLAHRVNVAASAALTARNYVSAIDVLVGIGWLEPRLLEDWRRGRVDYLERVVQANLSRISEAMKLFRSWAAARGLKPSETAYVRWTKGQRPPLRFSKSGNPHLERAYRTHFVSRAFAEKPRDRPSKKPSPSPELASVRWEDPDMPWLRPETGTFRRTPDPLAADDIISDLLLDGDDIPF
jgi:hypothetical protein